jgi:hypothetical protein
MIGLSRHALILVERVLEDMLGWEKHHDELRSRNRLGSQILVCTEKLNPRVVMVKSAQDGSLNRPRIRCILAKGSMSSDAVVGMSVRFQNPAEMRLAQNNDVVQTLAPDRSDQPFGKAVLPR